MHKKFLTICLLIIMSLCLCLVFASCDEKHITHVYDNNCDVQCNECNYVRLASHTYDNDCDDTCNLCNFKRTITHQYNDECDTDCELCGLIRETTHKYDNGCDKSCNICNAERETQHVYDNECDVNCNHCNETRNVSHFYDNACDKFCNLCNIERSVFGHKYDNEYDLICNECSYQRPATHTCIYEYQCSKICEICGMERLEVSHVYENACDTECNECDEVRTVGDHVYDNACDANCNICQQPRQPEEHKYDYDCDKECNVCGDIRTELTHVYENACDIDCEYCNENRVPPHEDEDHNKKCDICEFLMISDEEYAKVKAFLVSFNDYLYNIKTYGSRYSHLNNVKFGNIVVTGTLSNNFDVPYIGISRYENLVHYQFKDQSERFVISNDIGSYIISGYNNNYSYVGCEPLKQGNFGYFPELTFDDIGFTDEKYIVLSNEYLQALYVALVDSEIQSAWYFGNAYIDYAELIPLMDYSVFNSKIYLDENGNVEHYNISLDCGEKSYYTLSYSTSNAKSIINMYMNIGRIIVTDFTYMKGDYDSAVFNLKYNASTEETLKISTDIHYNIKDFVATDKQQAAFNDGHQKFERDFLMKETYGGEFECNCNCELLAYFDSTIQGYVLFQKNSRGAYVAQTIVFNLDNLKPCFVSFDEVSRTITVYSHTPIEQTKILSEKYNGRYTLLSDRKPSYLAVLDEEYNLYIIFALSSAGYEFSSYVTNTDNYEIAIVNQTNKTLTLQ